MSTVIFLVLRRLRTPLLLISFVYTIATFGLTVIPGVDDQGNAWQMDFFHAFYFVTFMGTTIGFGELPYPFTDGQRLWALISIYITVATWIYTIGAILHLIRDETLRRAITEYQFRNAVTRLREPFYLICGYGDTGSKLVDSLARRQILATVIEIKQERIASLILGDQPLFIPRLCADAGDPENLILGGIQHPMCAGIVALTDQDSINLHIAITAKVLNPDVKVICRADSHEIKANMKSFGTDYVVDPFDTFAESLSTALHSPNQYLLREWLRGESGEPLTELTPVASGKWVLCGYGRFGLPIYDQLIEAGIEVQVIEPYPEARNAPEGTVTGWGTEAVTLEEANIRDAVGIVAGTNDDSNNLSIIVTAMELNPELFTVVRHSEHYNRVLFENSHADIIMAPGAVVAKKIRTLLTNPLVDHFLSLTRAHDDDWAAGVIDTLRRVSRNRIPELWEVSVTEDHADAVYNAVTGGQQITISQLIIDHTDRERSISAVALVHENESGSFSMPIGDSVLNAGDRLLFAGTRGSRSNMEWTLQNHVALEYVTTGEVQPQSYIGKWLFSN